MIKPVSVAMKQTVTHNLICCMFYSTIWGTVAQSYKMDSCLTNSDAHVVSGSEDGNVIFWDLVDASIVASFKAHPSVVTSVSYHPSESRMLTASVDSTVRVWKS
jgi:mitogen-activated protein kinase organizer 1